MTSVTQAEIDEALVDLKRLIDGQVGDDMIASEVANGELTITIPSTLLLRLMQWLHDDSSTLFKQLIDVCGVDYPDREQRFDVVYHLLSLHHNQRLRVKVMTDEETPVPSVSGIYKSAGWFEREAWDMYGIMFADHPDLRRILTDYGFEGHPLRKDFPLTGYVEMRYDEEQKRVVYEPVKLRQDFRNFDFLSPWEGAQELLPGDEKAEETLSR
jgi:NADH-quinone oxidoreductase subunit C